VELPGKQEQPQGWIPNVTPSRMQACLAAAFLHVRSGEPERAKRCYLHYWVLRLGRHSPEDARRYLAERIRRSPGDATLHLQFGHLLGFEGSARSARAELRRCTHWRAWKSGRFMIHTVPGSTGDRDAPAILDDREAGLKRIESLFRLPLAAGVRIRYFLYESCLHKEAITGDPAPAHAFPGRAEVHSVHGLEMRLDGPHEDVHVLLHPLGLPPRFLQEGAAEWAQLGGTRPPLAYFLTRAEQVPSIRALLDDSFFLGSDPLLTYPLSASFVAHLVERWGVERFKALYGAPPGDTARAAREIYGMGVETLEREWRDHGAINPDGSAK
jgi:hypothetical protein